MSSFVFVRHARPQVAPDAPPSSWALTVDGKRDAAGLGEVLEASTWSGSVVCSPERKAIETATSAGFTGMAVDERLREVARPWYPDQGSFQAAATDYLRGIRVSSWEPIDEAIERFDAALEDAGDSPVVVGHGTIASAWIAAHDPAVDPVAFWTKLRMPDAWRIDRSKATVYRITPTAS